MERASLTHGDIPPWPNRAATNTTARGASSAASAASSAIGHMRDWAKGSAAGDWVSMGVPADGSYGVADGIVYSYPATCKDGQYEIVPGLEIAGFRRAMMGATEAELREERAGVAELL